MKLYRAVLYLYPKLGLYFAVDFSICWIILEQVWSSSGFLGFDAIMLISWFLSWILRNFSGGCLHLDILTAQLGQDILLCCLVMLCLCKLYAHDWSCLITCHRLDKRASILDFRLDCQDLERFSVINRFARFHGRGQVDGAETSSSSDATAVVQKPCPQRYVSAHPMPRNVPERVQCLSLWSSLIYWFSSRIGSIVSTSPNFA